MFENQMAGKTPPQRELILPVVEIMSRLIGQPEVGILAMPLAENRHLGAEVADIVNSAVKPIANRRSNAISVISAG